MAAGCDSYEYCCVSAVPFILDRQQNMRSFQFMSPLDWTLYTWRLRNFICNSDEMHGNICVSSYTNFFVRFCIGAKSHILQSSYIYYSQKVLACIDGLLFSGYTHKLNLSWIDLVVQIASLCVLTESETETFLDTLYILTTVFYRFFTYQI